ncbi:MAG: small multi-drug export protein [Candidatus Aenigmarchaeota archaeon]|nr:small multi-drug export protein [Candidatus Aenigmarchaeota archaeon]
MDFIDILKIIIISMSPFLELRGSIPYGIATGMNYPLVILISIVFNSLVFFPVYFGLEFFYHNFFSRFKIVRRIIQRTKKKGSKYVERYKILGIAIFVAIPLPFSGAYSGSILAWLMSVDWKKAYLAVLMGVCGAALIVSSASLGIFSLIK